MLVQAVPLPRLCSCSHALAFCPSRTKMFMLVTHDRQTVAHWALKDSLSSSGMHNALNPWRASSYRT